MRKIIALFHPDMTFGSSSGSRQRLPGAPLKLLFFGLDPDPIGGDDMGAGVRLRNEKQEGKKRR